MPVHAGTGRSLALLSRVAGRYDLVPLVQAVTTGAVSVEAASHVAGAFARLQRQVELEDWDLVMTGLIGWAAEGAIMGDLAEFEESMIARFGTDAEFDDRERRYDRRDFSLFRRNWRTGMYEARVELDPASDAVFSTALRALTPAPRDGADGAGGGEPDLRSVGARRADALLAMAAHATRPDKDTPGTGAKARIVVTMALTDLAAGLPGADWPPAHAAPGISAPAVDGLGHDTPGVSDDSPASADTRCDNDAPRGGCGITAFGQALTATQVRTLACDAQMIPAVLGTKGEILELGRARRLATPGLVTYLWERDRGCTYPGCGMPPAWCDAHHLRHWLTGGATDRDNLALLCRAHHTVVHRHGHTGQITPDGVRWHRDDGTPIGNHPRLTTTGS